ncbi:MAG: DUF1643 domain-containing protein [Acholeplasmatales bacterium]|jgi:hypothetical protein|nr:DUF1643 domain-containing protein [Acholeplasmatales bacterium]
MTDISAYEYGIGWLYYTDNQNKNRYVLGQVFKNTSNILVCFGLNPSTATPLVLDNTINKIINVANQNAYDGWIMLNMYAVRNTNPNMLDKIINTNVHNTNMKVISNILEHFDIREVWYAYGDIIEVRDYISSYILKDINNYLDQKGIKRFTFSSITKKNNPRHPLYLCLKELIKENIKYL